MLLALVVTGLVAYFVIDEPRPAGRAGPEAEALASRIERAVDLEAWARTKAVSFRFAGRHEHLWDRERDLVRVRWSDHEVLLHAFTANGRAYTRGREVVGDEARDLLESANGYFVNDSFWLNPLAKLHDPGTSRALVTLEGARRALWVEYASGGLTPGDGYLWIIGEDDRPSAWRLWVSIVPIGGVETSWEGWTELPTGAWIATRHRGPFGLTLVVDELHGRETLAELLVEQGARSEDPFAPLVVRDTVAGAAAGDGP